MSAKVLIIGLDGASFDIIKPLLKKGDLPNIGKLMENGCHGNLKSTPEKISPAAWTSFSTGKNPAKHGITTFCTIDPSTMRMNLLNSTHRDGDTLWTLFSREGKKTGIFSVPSSFPSDKVNGFMIAGWDSPGLDKEGFSFPPEIIKDIRERFGDFSLSPAILKHRMGGKPDVCLEELTGTLEIKGKIASYLLNKDEWDIFITVFTATDEVQHYFWHYMDERHPKHNPRESKMYGEAINDVYRKSDKIIGELLKGVDDNTTVVIMSDHGGGINSNGTFFLPGWLDAMGFSAMKNNFPKRPNSSSEAGGLWKIKTSISKEIKKIIPYKFKFVVKKFLALEEKLDFMAARLAGCDWSKTKVYMDGPNLRINLAGREAYGIVSPGKEYDELVERVKSGLESLVDEKTGKKVVKKAFKRELSYNGPYMDRIPDLIIDWADDYVTTGISFKGPDGRNVRITDEYAPDIMWSGKHTDFGIFIMEGPDVPEGKEIDGAQIMDIAPTIMHLSGLEVPDDMDGKVLADAITGKFMESSPVRYKHAGQTAEKVKGKVYSDDDKKKVEEQLKNMGYL